MRTFVLVIGLFVFLFGFREAVRGIRLILLAKKSTSWPTTQGVITHSEIQLNGGGDAGYSYLPAIAFTYTVNGCDYTSTAIWVRNEMQFFAGTNFAASFTSRYPVGNNVTVAYDPKNPEMGVLETGLRKLTFVSFGAGLWATLGGTAMLIFWWKVL